MMLFTVVFNTNGNFVKDPKLKYERELDIDMCSGKRQHEDS